MTTRRRDPTPEELDDLRSGLTFKQMQDRYHVGASTLQRWRREYLDPDGHFYEPEPIPSTLADIAADTEDPDKAWRLYEDAVYRHNKQFRQTLEHNITLKDKGPVMVVNIADAHIGAAGTDLRHLRRYLETIRDTDGMYAVFAGDMAENTTSSRAHHGAHHTRAMGTKTERMLVEHAARIVGEKLLVWYTGNHEARTDSDDGASFIETTAARLGVRYGGHVGYINLTLGKVEYKILVSHTGRGGGMDKARPAKKLAEEWGDADTVFTGHRHVPAIAGEYVRRGFRAFASSGSFKIYDEFGLSRSLPPVNSDQAGCIYWPDRKRQLILFDALENVDLFKRERAHYLEMMGKG